MILNNDIEKIKNQLLGGMTADFFTSHYNQCNDNEKVIYFKNIVNAANYVFTYNDTYGTLNETTQKIGTLTFIPNDDVLKVRNKLSSFLSNWITEESNIAFNRRITLDFLQNDRPFFFILLSQNYDKGLLDYHKFISYLINEEISLNISAFEFLKEFKLSIDHQLSCYNYVNAVERYFDFKEIKGHELYDLYCLSFKTNNGRPVFNEYTNKALTNILRDKFCKNELNKIQFFQYLFDQQLKFNAKDPTLGLAINDFMDEDIAQKFSNNIIKAIPDNGSVIKKNIIHGIYHSLKLLDKLEITKKDPVIEILYMLKMEPKKFTLFFEQNGLDNTVHKLTMFKNRYPNIYKSAFTNKNPIVVHRSKLKSLSIFELVMMHMDLDKSLLKNNIKNRL